MARPATAKEPETVEAAPVNFGVVVAVGVEAVDTMVPFFPGAGIEAEAEADTTPVEIPDERPEVVGQELRVTVTTAGVE